MTIIELTESESAVWARMPPEDRELLEAALGAMIRAWDKWHPQARVIELASHPRATTRPPPPPDDFEDGTLDELSRRYTHDPEETSP